MTEVENLDLYKKFPSNILNAPKIKFKIPIVSPPPLSLNEPNSKLEIKLCNNYDQSFSNENTNASMLFDNEVKSLSLTS